MSIYEATLGDWVTWSIWARCGDVYVLGSRLGVRVFDGHSGRWLAKGVDRERAIRFISWRATQEIIR